MIELLFYKTTVWYQQCLGIRYCFICWDSTVALGSRISLSHDLCIAYISVQLWTIICWCCRWEPNPQCNLPLYCWHTVLRSMYYTGSRFFQSLACSVGNFLKSTYSYPILQGSELLLWGLNWLQADNMSCLIIRWLFILIEPWLTAGSKPLNCEHARDERFL